MTKIKNVPNWAWDKHYFVVRYVDGAWWFYDAWKENEERDAMAQCWEIDGELFLTDHCVKG